jgi:hypothetical protein
MNVAPVGFREATRQRDRSLAPPPLDIPLSSESHHGCFLADAHVAPGPFGGFDIAVDRFFRIRAIRLVGSYWGSLGLWWESVS